MPSKALQEYSHPTTPSINHQAVIVETNGHTTTSPLTSSLGGSPSRTVGELTPEHLLARNRVMSHYPPNQQSQPQSQPPQQPASGRDTRYVQMISTGHPPPHFQGHVAYLPPNIPQLYHGHPGGSAQYVPAPGSYPSQQQHQQHHGANSGPPHPTYVIAGYPPGHGPGPPPAGSQYIAVNAVPQGSYPPQAGTYYSHHPHSGHPNTHPPSPLHRSHGSSAPPPGAPVYVPHGHGPHPPGSGPYPVLYAPPPTSSSRGPEGGPVMPSVHPSTVSKSSTHLSEPEQSATQADSMHTPHDAVQSMERIQAEREKEEMAMEQVLKSVKPIQTDYHLFVEEEKNKHTEAAALDGGDDPYLRNSSLNYRLKAAWEALDPSQRAILFKREELDRKRFMEEEEIASRHCATLTARNTSTPRKKTLSSTAEVTVDEEVEEETRDEDTKRARETEEAEEDESPLKKERLEQVLDSVGAESV